MKSPMIQALEDILQHRMDERDVAEDSFVNANYIGDKIAIINARLDMIKSYAK